MAHGLHKCQACGSYRTASTQAYIHCLDCKNTSPVKEGD